MKPSLLRKIREADAWGNKHQPARNEQSILSSPSLGVEGCSAKWRECNGDTEGKEMFLFLLKKRRIKHHITFHAES